MDQVLERGSTPETIPTIEATLNYLIDTGEKIVTEAGAGGTADMRGGKLDVFWRIRLPCALPSMFAGLKVGISLALVGTIVGEFVASDHGLGYIILTAQGTFETPQIFAANLILALMGTILFGIVTLVERRLIPWHASHHA